MNGMHCENCQNRVQRKLNSIDGASARVNLKKKLAVVEMSREISDEELTEAVKNAGYEVEKIERKD
ncbi:MAG: cation transporter [Oscillospiraceae bacterium]|nr:cation transporter [Oscillospiraceae bacterium]